MLNITCDNASSNDTMMDELEDRLDGFGGKTNRTRCFAHVVNLVAVTITRQFDAPKAGKNATANDAKAELAELAKGIELEDLIAIGQDESEEDENCEDWIDEREDMTSDELDELEESVRPVTRVLVKVRSAVFRVSWLLTITPHAPAAKAFVCGRQFDDDSPAYVVQPSRCPQDEREEDTSRCHYAMELHVRHAALCTRVPRGHRQNVG